MIDHDVCGGTACPAPFEVTPDGRIVWEYLNPFHGEVPGWHPPGTEKVPYAAFRATEIPPDHPALVSRDLRPVAPQPEPYLPPSVSGKS